MSYVPNKWDAISRFYKHVTPLILNAKSNEWAIPPYEWEECDGIVFTPIETALWHDIRAANAVMYPQYPIYGMFVDFANPVAKVAIECDGAEFHKDKARDAARDEILQSKGWMVYRITGRDCKTDFDEETKQEGNAKKFINEICKNHKVATF
jgi:very-short-patch-repair endonuclease